MHDETRTGRDWSEVPMPTRSEPETCAMCEREYQPRQEGDPICGRKQCAIDWQNDLLSKPPEPVLYHRTCNACLEPYEGTGRLLCERCFRRGERPDSVFTRAEKNRLTKFLEKHEGPMTMGRHYRTGRPRKQSRRAMLVRAVIRNRRVKE